MILLVVTNRGRDVDRLNAVSQQRRRVTRVRAGWPGRRRRSSLRARLLIYVVLFSASLFAFVLSFTSFHARTLKFSGAGPRRLTGVFMIVGGTATLGIWLMEPVASLPSGDMPKGFETHTTLFTHAFDMAVIVPTAIAEA